MSAAGSGEPLVLLHAFGLSPRTYDRTIDLLSDDARVVAPWWGRLEERWRFDRAVDALTATFDANEIEGATLVGHSFGGALATAFAAAHPDRVRALVVVDALVLSPGRRELIRLGLRPRHLITYSSYPAARDFMAYAARHPRDLASVAWRAYRTDLPHAVEELRRSSLRRVVMWGANDGLLPVEIGRTLAAALGASFVAAAARNGERIEHDWAYRHPHRFVEELRAAVATVPPPTA